MKNIFKMLTLSLSLIIVLSNVHAETQISKNTQRKISGPECMSHLINVLKLKAEAAYQICTSPSEEVKICLMQNGHLSKKETLEKCYKK